MAWGIEPLLEVPLRVRADEPAIQEVLSESYQRAKVTLYRMG